MERSTDARNSSKIDKAMTPEQFTQIVEAILEGKYSWACVLILRFAGYNPLHYIPYRTHNRLVKENAPTKKHPRRYSDSGGGDPEMPRSIEIPEPRAYLNNITDLTYLESVSESNRVQGGRLAQWLTGRMPKYCVSRTE